MVGEGIVRLLSVLPLAPIHPQKHPSACVSYPPVSQPPATDWMIGARLAIVETSTARTHRGVRYRPTFTQRTIFPVSCDDTMPVPEDTPPWIMPTVASHSYSPNVGEAEFRDLPLYGVLRSPLPDEVATWRIHLFADACASVAALYDFIRHGPLSGVWP